MEIKKYSDFILNEARVAKDEVKEALIDMLKKKPKVEMTTLPDEKGIYSLAGLKSHLGEKYNNTAIGNALIDLQNDKKSGLGVVSAYISVWKKKVPYWYIGLTEAEAKKIATQYEKEEAEKNKKQVTKQAEKTKPAAKKAAKKTAAPKVTKAAKSTTKKEDGRPEPAKKTATRGRKSTKK